MWCDLFCSLKIIHFETTSDRALSFLVARDQECVRLSYFSVQLITVLSCLHRDVVLVDWKCRMKRELSAQSDMSKLLSFGYLDDAKSGVKPAAADVSRQYTPDRRAASRDDLSAADYQSRLSSATRISSAAGSQGRMNRSASQDVVWPASNTPAVYVLIVLYAVIFVEANACQAWSCLIFPACSAMNSPLKNYMLWLF